MPIPESLYKLLHDVYALGQRRAAHAALTAIKAEALAAGCARKSTKRARGSASAKKKGRAGVLQTRQWILRVFGLEPDDVLVQTTSVGGSDLHYSPVAQRTFPFAPEIKNVEALNIWDALRQAEINAARRKLHPVLFFKRNGTDLYVAFKAKHLPLVTIPEAIRGQVVEVSEVEVQLAEGQEAGSSAEV